MAAIQSAGGTLRSCVSHEVFPRSLSMPDRNASSMKTSGVLWTRLSWIGVALCVLAIPTLVLKDNAWMQKNIAEPQHMFVYLFNWTNMYDPLNAHVKPNFVQLGPYVFRADVRGPSTRTWFFEQHMSIGTRDDLVGIFHPPDPIVANRIRSWNQYLRKLMDFTLNTKAGCMSLDEAARKWLFEGYYDPLTEAAKLLDSELIPWYFRQHNASTEEWSNPINEWLTYGPCIAEGSLQMLVSDLKARGNSSNVRREGTFSDNDIVGILRDLSEFYAPFVIVTERVTRNQTLDRLRKFTLCWLDSHWLALGTGAVFLLIGGMFHKTKNLHVPQNQL